MLPRRPSAYNEHLVGGGEAVAKKSRTKKGRRWRRRLVIAALGLAVVILAGAGVAAALLAGALRGVPSVTTYQPRARASSFILDRNGDTVTRILGAENRQPIPLECPAQPAAGREAESCVPKHVQDAFVAVEDERFWQHRGVDVVAVLRALYNDLLNRPIQGGSTITQQLARNAFPIGSERTLRRKVQEAFLALELERRYTKKEILEMYLNQIFFGRDAYGIEAAARTYFGKPARNLSLAEGALLAGLPQSPNFYDPTQNPAAALRRRNLVLDLMVRNGFITSPMALAAKAQPLGVTPPPPRNYPAPHFVDYVLAQLLRRYPAEKVYGGGLRVYTTLDLRVQQAAEKAVQEVLAKEFPTGKEEPPQAAVVVLEQETGYVRAMVGGRTHHRTLELNRAWYDERAGCCARQPGSAFKPLAVYVPALSQGMTPATVVDDRPMSYKTPQGTWQPKNYDRVYRGPTTFREAVRRSVNTVAVQTLEKVGVDEGLATAQRLGISTLVTAGPVNDRNLALALGGLTKGASVLDMARAYAAIANGGYRVEPVAILRVEDSYGNVLENNRPKKERVIKPEVAYLMTDILRTVVERPRSGGWLENWGTGEGAKVPNWPTAGKTGTTEEQQDVWFVGFTPYLTAAVWIGYDNPEKPRKLPPRFVGGRQPAAVFKSLMTAAHAGLKPSKEFPLPPGVKLVRVPVSALSGLRPGPETPPEMVRTELFPAGKAPTGTDPGWIPLRVCRDKPDLAYEDGCSCQPATRYFSKADGGAGLPRVTCSGNTLPPPASEGEPAAPSGPTAPQEGAPSPEDGGSTGGAQEGGAANPLELTAAAGVLSPTVLTAPAGPITLRITARDAAHRLRIPDLGVVLDLAAGATTTVTVRPEPGSYLIICDLHEGEVARLVVTP